MTRRYFFLGSAAASAAAAQTAVSANDKVSVGVVGVGGRGRALLRDFTSLPDVELKAICDADEASIERARTALNDQGVAQPAAHADMRRLFDDQSLDAVVIATPDHWHTPAAILACDAGKDVYVEKPCSHNIREGRLLVEAARRNKRVVQHGTQSRSRPDIIEAIERLRSGEIGRVLMAKAWDIQLRDDIGRKQNSPVPQGVDWDLYLGPTPWIPFNENRFHYNWHWHWHFGTGDAGNDGVHQIDVARWALGEEAPTMASGMGRKVFFDDDQQTPDTMNVTFEYGGEFGDKALIWEMRIWNPYKMEGVDNGVAVYGSGGMMQIGRWSGSGGGYKLYDEKGQETEFVPARRAEHARNFLDCVKSRSTPNADIGEGHLSAMHAHLANIVARTGSGVRFETESETAPGNPEANAYVKRAYRRHWAKPVGV